MGEFLINRSYLNFGVAIRTKQALQGSRNHDL